MCANALDLGHPALGTVPWKGTALCKDADNAQALMRCWFIAAAKCARDSKHPGEGSGVARPVVRGRQVVGAPSGDHTRLCPAAALSLPG